jgi:hypothetical protein
MIVLEGINDIGWPHRKPRLPNDTTMKEAPFAGELVTTQELIMDLQQIIARAHQHGIRVFGATLTRMKAVITTASTGRLHVRA